VPVNAGSACGGRRRQARYSAGATENIVTSSTTPPARSRRFAGRRAAGLKLPPGTIDMAGTGFVGGLAMAPTARRCNRPCLRAGISAIDLSGAACPSALAGRAHTVIPAADGRRLRVAVGGGALALDAATWPRWR
jgi:hypothetical protein